MELARHDPVVFAKQVLRLDNIEGEPTKSSPDYNPHLSWELDEWQCEMLEAMADVWLKKDGQATRRNHAGKTSITVRACQGPGKTFGIAVAAHVFGFIFHPMAVVVVAPKLEHIQTRFMAEFAKITNRAIPGYASLLDMHGSRIYWSHADRLNHVLIAETGRQPENVQGLRRTHTLYLVDESSGVDEKIWPVVEGNLSGTELGICIEIGNPTKNVGHFAQSHLKANLAADYYRMHVGPANSRRIKREWIEKLERRYGKDSPVVQVRCYGEFAAADSNQLIALEWIQNARSREVNHIIGDGSLPQLRISVDCAAGGDDETVITACRHFQSMMIGLKQKRYSFPLETASQKTADMAELMFIEHGGRMGTDDFVVDMLGVGVGAGGELIKRGHAVVMYQGGSASDNQRFWRNRRVQSYMNLRNDFRDGIITLLDTFFDDPTDWDEFDAQLCSIRTAQTERLEDLITKEEMKRQGIKSPDMADSLAMQRATQQPKTIPVAVDEPRDVLDQGHYEYATALDGYI